MRVISHPANKVATGRVSEGYIPIAHKRARKDGRKYITVSQERVAKDGYTSNDYSKWRRINGYVDKETFDLLREQALQRGIGVAAVLREVIDAGIIHSFPRS